MTVNDQPPEGLPQELASLRQRNAELELQVATYQNQIATDDIFFTHALELLSIIDAKGVFTRVNAAWTNRLGYELEELLDHPFVTFLHPDDLERTLQETEQLINAGSTFAFENRYRHKDGSFRNMQWTCSCNPETKEIYSVTIDITDQKRAEQERDIYVGAMQHLPNPLWISHLADPSDPSSCVLDAVNHAAERFATNGKSLNDQIGRRVIEVSEYITPANLQRFVDVAVTGHSISFDLEFKDDQGTSIFTVLVFSLPNQHFGVLYVDITEQKQAEETLRQSIRQEEIIQAQKLILDELSTPLIPISDKIVVMPLIGSVDSHRAQQVLETLLNGIASTRATFVILDITGVTVVDSQVADAFIRAAQAVRLLGAQVMITGIRPEVAQTLIGLGVDLSGIITSSSLQSGIAKAMAMGQH